MKNFNHTPNQNVSGKLKSFSY